MQLPKPLIRASVFVNDCTGGPKGWSLCARMWEGRLNNVPLAYTMCRITDTLFWFDPQHCRKAWLVRNT